MTTLNGFFHVKLQPKLCILMMNPKHCEPAQTVWDHVGGPLLFIVRAGAGTEFGNETHTSLMNAQACPIIIFRMLMHRGPAPLEN